MSAVAGLRGAESIVVAIYLGECLMVAACLRQGLCVETAGDVHFSIVFVSNLPCSHRVAIATD